MKISQILKSVAFAAAVAATGSASAAAVTVDKTIGAGDAYYITSATGSLSFSSDALTAFSLGGVTVSAAPGATYASPTVTVPVNSFTYESTTNVITRLATGGGAVQSIATAGLVGGPGSINVTNVTIDPIAKIAYADVSGTNITSQNVAFFNLAAINGTTSFSGAGTFTAGATGLTLTSSAVSLVQSALKLNSFGANVLAGISNFGSLSSTITVAAVPEPSTYALIGLGLGGAAFMARRRKQAA